MSGSSFGTHVSSEAKRYATRQRHTVLGQQPHALHVDPTRPKACSHVGSHGASSNDIAADAFRAVVRAGVLGQTDQAVLACSVCGACDENQYEFADAQA